MRDSLNFQVDEANGVKVLLDMLTGYKFVGIIFDRSLPHLKNSWLQSK